MAYAMQESRKVLKARRFVVGTGPPLNVSNKAVPEDAIPHLFLLKKTPSVLQPNLEDVEVFILRSFASSVRKVLEQVPFPKLDSVKSMLEKWLDVQPRTGDSHRIELFQKQVAALKNGQTLPVYITQQNATLLITKREEAIEISTYRSSLPNKMVMSTVGSHSILFPETRETVQRMDILASKEFATQVYELAVGDIDISLAKTIKGGQEFNEPRDVPDPQLVTDWIVGLLVPGDGPQNLQIRKKIRDQVTFTTKAAGSLPFRRSGMLMSLKVALQLKITENLDNNLELGKYVYKLLMLRILADFADKFLQEQHKSVDLDVGSQILAKIGNRVKKLSNFPLEITCPQSFTDAVIYLRDCSLRHTELVISALSSKMQTKWKNICSAKGDPNAPSTKPSPKSQSEQLEQDLKDLEHNIPKLDTFLELVSNSVTERQICNTGNDPQPVDRYLNSSTIKSGPAQHSMSSGNNVRIWLFDTENYIKFSCSPEKDSASVIYEILTMYAEKAVAAYNNDPIGMSQLALVSFRGLQLLDQIATKYHPDLLDYRLELDTKVLYSLLLPYKKDMELLEHLMDYFEERNEDCSFDESGVLGRNIDDSSYCVQYAQEDDDMIDLRERILADTETGIQAKYSEANRFRGYCNNIIEQISTSTCECEFEQTQVGRKRRVKCDRCNLVGKLRCLKKRVERYECPLPESETLQWAVVFELRIPQEFAFWRAFLAFFKFEILGQQIFDGEGNHISQEWLSYSKLQQYKWRGYPNTNLKFGSKSKPTSRSYLNRNQNLDLTTEPNEEYIIFNGMGCHLQYVALTSIQNVKKVCSFLLESAEGCKSYANLQSTVDGTSHSQNSVIAKQYGCHESLTLREFVAFGSLRAGHRIQLRNLYEAIYSGNISLERESVLALVLQTIWQVGPQNEKKELESHLDFEELHFAEQFVDMLDSLVKANAANYSSAQILLAAVMITRRIGEINENLLEKISTVLQQWRAILKTWTDKVLKELNNDNECEANYASLKHNLLEILLCSMLSYNIVDSSSLTHVMKEEKDVSHWLRAIHLLHTELKGLHFGLSTFSKNLLSFAKLLPLRLNLEHKVVKGSEKMFRQSLFAFIPQVWHRGQHAVAQRIGFSKSVEKCCVVVIQYNETNGETFRLTFDFVQGAFLVNGNSESQLPDMIQESELFQRYFQDASNLRVRQENDNLTTTINHYRGRHYEFHESTVKVPIPSLGYSEKDREQYQDYHDGYSDVSSCSSMGSTHQPRGLEYSDVSSCSSMDSTHQSQGGLSKIVVIKEIQEDGSKLVLLNHKSLIPALSNYFIDNYSHWLDTSQNIVLFRPNQDNTQDQVSPEDYLLEQVKKDGKAVWKLHDVRTQEYFLSIASKGFEMVRTSLARLELPNYINVTMNKEHEKTAFLRRHNLRFRIKNHGRHESVEYPGFTITANQQAKGTLIGLCHGLLMKNNIRHIYVVPHSSIVLRASDHHQKVEIGLSTLRQPSCFVYEFDDVLKRLKAHNSKSAWLYLAALHAATSSPLPDPFTRVTGTEMCVGLLQSACVWSCSPYEKESKDILRYIKSLAPKRKYYGRQSKEDEDGSMEMVEWPESLPSMAAYDGYAIIVDKLFEDSKRLEVLHGKVSAAKKEEKQEKPPALSVKLLLRAYLRHLSCYNAIATVDLQKYMCPSQLSLLGQKNVVEELCIRKSSEKLQFVNLIQTANARLGSGIASFTNPDLPKKNNLLAFLIQPEPLGPSAPEICLNEVGAFQELLHLDFRYNWLKLYKMAISCTSEEKVNAFTIVLCAATYRGAQLEQIANLHCISQHAKHGITFPSLTEIATGKSSPKKFQPGLSLDFTSLAAMLGHTLEYPNPSLNTYNDKSIIAVLKSCTRPFVGAEKPIKPIKNHTEPYHQFKLQMMEYEAKQRDYNVQETAYLANLHSRCNELAPQLKKMLWKCRKIEYPEIKSLLESNEIESWKAIPQIDNLLEVWYKNEGLTVFLKRVQSQLNLVIDQIQSRKSEAPVKPFCPKESFTEVSKVNATHTTIKLENLLNWGLGSMMSEVKSIYANGKFNLLDNSAKRLFTKQQCIQRKINEIRADILHMATGNIYGQIINQTPLAPRLSPRNILKYLIEHPTSSGDGNEEIANRKVISDYAGALAVLQTHIKQVNRCIQGVTPFDLERETKNQGHTNWSPAEFPEWLLLELELDIMIRPVQVDVARQMITMPNGGNGVTQLNMGEGKTSVIVPMLCSTLAKKDQQLCRVTVLSSMYNMNLSSLTFAIGGLLNRRVYSLPCRRDLAIDEDCVVAMDQVYRECLNLQGVVLTLPEHRLSFRLLAYDKILKKDVSLGLKMLDIENWLRNYARDVLDESDELLSVKYQLVYTVGEHLPIDGGDLRWTTCQRLLEIVQNLGVTLVKTHGNSVWEFRDDPKKPHEFLSIRLLDPNFINKFMSLVADQILEEVMISEKEKKIVKNFLVKQETSKEDHVKVMEQIFKEMPNMLPKILIYSGYLRRGVLSLALIKRWRVEYGVEQKFKFRKMAVPFRAKDVAAEKTEFGHPDLAIILTHLSYYYSGLSDDQLIETFAILKRKLVADTIYSSWVQKLPAEGTPEFLRNYKSLNLKDRSVRCKLFNLLRRHKLVVDFWLAHCVFPRESKQFPGKLVMSSWDLCYERHRFPVTGFSGTNDSQVLLPLMITQQDLPALQMTNKNVEETLLQPENGNHQGLQMGVTCKEILELMKKDNLTVLVDAGALMLELTNKLLSFGWK